MLVCVTSDGRDLDAAVDARFGRCRNFFFVDTDTLDFETVENPGLTVSGGAGVQAGQLMVARRVAAVLTGNVGPNAHQVLSAAGIKVYTGVTGTVRAAVEGFKRDAYRPAESPSVVAKFGMPKK